jgi:hypothetical protein
MSSEDTSPRDAEPIEHDPALIDLIALLIQSATGAALDPMEVMQPSYGQASEWAYLLADDFAVSWATSYRSRHTSASMKQTLEVILALPHMRELPNG